MKLPFLNRFSELSRVGKAIQSKDPKLVIIYGRRRCGKSRLLNQLRDVRLVYHLADLSEPALQRMNLAKDISRHFPGFADVIFPTWDALFKTFFERVSRTEEAFPVTLILDEFPYIAQLDSSVSSVLQKIYDSGHLGSHLILCGSSQRMMHGIALNSLAPLYGRAAEILKIRPLSPGWIGKALSVQGQEAINAYSVWGGVPRYWEAAKPYKNLSEAVSELVLNRDGLFHLEPHRLLMDDMRSDVQPHSLLSVIAGGARRLSEIAGRLGKQAVSLSNPLGLLSDLGYIKRDIPFGESLRSTKRTLYRLNDPFLLFWYRYVYPSLSLLEQDVVDAVLSHWDATFSQHVGEIWEELARLSVPHSKIAGIQWKDAYRWWGNGKNSKPMEIDVIAESFDRNVLLFGEAKWGDHINIKNLFDKINYCIENFPGMKRQKVIKVVWLKKRIRFNIKDNENILSPNDVLQIMK